MAITTLLTVVSQQLYADLPRMHEFVHNHQKEKDNERAPEGVTIDDHLAQIWSDLGGYSQGHPISEEEIDSACSVIRRHLEQCRDIRDYQQIRTAIHNGLIEHTGNKTARILSDLRDQGYNLTMEDIHSIVKSKQGNMAARLKQTSHISGENLAQFFGQTIYHEIMQQINNSTYAHYNQPHPTQLGIQHHYTPQQPKPSAPHMPTITHQQKPTSVSPRLMHAKKHSQTLHTHLQSTQLSSDTKQRLLQLMYDNILFVHTIPANDFIVHMRSALAQLLDEQLEKEKKTLSGVIRDKGKLQDSLNTTRATLIAQIVNMKTINPTIMNSMFANDNLKETILSNMEISCPVCYDYFKEEHSQGEVQRIILKAANKNKICGHAVCKNCVHHCKHVCPMCRETIDNIDLAQKLRH
jgi:hypothetical protein